MTTSAAVAETAIDSHPLLRVRDLSLRFRGIVALDGVSFDVARGHICGIIGPNGAGKTTLFNCLSRIYDCDRGTIELDGRVLTQLPCHAVAALGIGRTFQNLALFPTMSVLENIMVGGHCRSSTGYLANFLRWPSVVREERSLRRRADDLIALLDLDAVACTRVMDLPFGTRKRVELARALAVEPKLLLLDEPAGGLNHEEVDALQTLIRSIRSQLDLTLLLVEHHMNLVMRMSDQVVVFDFGRKIADGKPAEVQNNPDVIRAYLGPDE